MVYYNKSFKPLVFILFALTVVTFSSTALDSGDANGAERPVDWAIRIEKKGLPNFFKVSDTLYRGAQPTKEGFPELKKMGIKTIINLREYHTDEDLIKGMGFTYFQIPISTSNPIRSHYQKALDIINKPDLQPVFIHCQHGADRTGTTVALYRITVQKWDTEEAIREMRDGGYGYHTVFKEIIKFVRTFNSQS
jgi:protein tyrosine/serine phosphatase